MTLPTYVGSGAFGASASTLTPGWPAQARQLNDIALLVVESENQTISLSSAQSFVEVLNSPQGTGAAGSAGSTRLAVYWRRLSGAADTAPTIADAGDHVTGQLHVFRGVVTSGDPWNVTAGGVDTTSDTSGSIPGTTTTVDDCLVVLLCSSSRNGTGTAEFSGYTNADLANILERTDNTNTIGLGGGHGMATGEKASAGAYGATAVTLANASLKAMLSIALKPAPTAYTITAEPGSYGVTGPATTAVLLGHLIAAAAGSYGLTGTDAGTFKGSAVAAEAGAYSLTGTDAVLIYTPSTNYILAADPGSYGVTGTSVSLFANHAVIAEAGSYALTGTDAGVLANHKVTAEAGTYDTTGTNASLLRGYALALEAGLYSLSGTDAGLAYQPGTGYVLTTDSGSYGLTGSTAALLHGHALTVEAGTYALTGSTVNLSAPVRAVSIAIHSLTVALPTTHSQSVSVRRYHGSSVMDTYTTANGNIRTANGYIRTSQGPMV